MLERSRRTAVLALLLATLTSWLAYGHAPSARAAENPRILVYGDSITQGSSGDRTWRCVLWRHLISSGVTADMVGPRRDLYNWRDNEFGSTAYADPSCDQDHASQWGLIFGTGSLDVSDLVDDYRPDVVVALIGLNNMLWLGASPDYLLQLWRDEIAQARSVAPHTSFVLVPVPEHWFGGVTAYDDALPTLESELDSQESRVVVTDDPGFQIDRDTFDDAHPSANGELRIAAVVADALSRIGLGTSYPRPLPEVAPGPAFAPTPRVSAGVDRLTVTWPDVEYANAMRVWSRDETAGGPWLRRTDSTTSQSWTTSAPPGHTFGIRLQPVKGRLPGGTLSAVARVRIPARPAAVTRLRALRRARCHVQLTWSPARFATGYRVTLRDVSAQGPVRILQGPGQTRRQLLTPRLHRRHRFAVTVRSFGPLAGGVSRAAFRSCR
jgi:hypothetical protein